MQRARWREIATLSWDEQLAKLKDPAFTAPLVADDNGFIYLPILNYQDGNLDLIKGLLEHNDTVVSLSAGGKRLLQKAYGHVAIIKSGKVTFREGEVTHARPGSLIRSPQNIKQRVAAE